MSITDWPRVSVTFTISEELANDMSDEALAAVAGQDIVKKIRELLA